MTPRWRIGRMAAAATLCGLAATNARAAEGADAGLVPNVFLAGVPLGTLQATRQRPLFLPSRRAPEAAAAAAALAPPPIAARSADEPPRLTLLGIIRTPESGGSAVVMDDSDRTSLSLKPGESRRGWVVRAIGPDTVTLQKQDRTVALSFPKSRPAPLLPAE